MDFIEVANGSAVRVKLHLLLMASESAHASDPLQKLSATNFSRNHRDQHDNREQRRLADDVQRPLPPLIAISSLHAFPPLLHLNEVHESAVSVLCLSPDHLWREISKQVSCYAFFEWWLLLSQHPCCLRNFTSSLCTEHRFRDLNWRSGLFPF